jgi:paraquat-inducible protein B
VANKKALEIASLNKQLEDLKKAITGDLHSFNHRFRQLNNFNQDLKDQLDKLKFFKEKAKLVLGGNDELAKKQVKEDILNQISDKTIQSLEKKIKKNDEDIAEVLKRLKDVAGDIPEEVIKVSDTLNIP